MLESLIIFLQYNDPDFVSKIKQTTGDTIHHAFDAISLPNTQKDTVKVLGSGPGRVWMVSGVDGEARELRADVTINGVCSYAVGGIDPSDRSSIQRP